MELNCLIFIKYQIRKFDAWFSIKLGNYSINLRVINVTWDVFYMVCAIIKRCTMQQIIMYSYRILEGYGLGEQTRLDYSCTSGWNGSGKLRRARQSSCSLCARGGTNGMLFTNAKTNTPINYKTILLLQAPRAPTGSARWLSSSRRYRVLCPLHQSSTFDHPHPHVI